MAIFANLRVETIVQVNDRTRLDASQSFVTPDEDAIQKIEIQPDSSADWLDVTADQFLDWQYDTAGEKTVGVRVTTSGSPVSSTASLTAVTEAEDALFSSDADLMSHEPGVFDYLKAGRNSFKDMHRRAQALVLKWIEQKGYRDSSGDRLTKAAIIDKEEVNLWSTFIALRLIFDGVSNATDDIFAKKALSYGRMEAQARDRAFLSLDQNGDGEADTTERIEMSSVKVVRR